MSFRKRVAVFFAALVAALGLAAAPAQAAWESCPQHGFCLYSQIDGGGTWYFAVVEGLSNNTCVALPAHRNNWAESGWNRAHFYTVRLYTSASCGGTMIGEMDQNEYLGYFGKYVDTASSYRVLEYA
jgi:hypothetical protein